MSYSIFALNITDFEKITNIITIPNKSATERVDVEPVIWVMAPYCQ